MVVPLVLPAGETFTFDSEKIVLETGDKIVALGESPNKLSSNSKLFGSII